MYHGLHTNIKLFTAFMIIWNASWAANQHVRFISEDWSNDAENTDLITEINCILKYILAENIAIKL